LLFRINVLQDLAYACIPYGILSTYIPTDTLPLAYTAASGPVNPPIGFGDPSAFATVNHLFVGNVPSSFDERAESGLVVPTLYDMIDAIERRKPGLPYSFTYYSADATQDSAIAWLPDFPSCDNAGAPSNAGTEYGNVSLALTFEIFQATP
jgi:hypothetical protein